MSEPLFPVALAGALGAYVLALHFVDDANRALLIALVLMSAIYVVAIFISGGPCDR
ncbi:hypothetical protein [Xanthomonas massiliensis]|uniref:hypothetical protein n=1 Tax=Xanthomonas massiliensis TaxID=1720302 RepID=UPI0013661EE1|nr:hypothetical protein [Xanthomonas massiliensis]